MSVRLVRDHSREMCDWVAARIPQMHGYPFPESSVGFGIEDAGGRLLGALVYHEWQPNAGTIQASWATVDPRWALAREAWHEMFMYAFEACGCHKIWGATPRSNERSLRFLRGLGLHFEAILEKHFGPDEDAVISSIFRWEYTRPFPRDNAGHPNPARNVNHTKARRNGKTRPAQAA